VSVFSGILFSGTARDDSGCWDWISFGWLQAAGADRGAVATGAAAKADQGVGGGGFVGFALPKESGGRGAEVSPRCRPKLNMSIGTVYRVVAECGIFVRMAWPHLPENPADYDKQMERVLSDFLTSVSPSKKLAN
jgi:hypothetical protein